jgi:hypothetical protein
MRLNIKKLEDRGVKVEVLYDGGRKLNVDLESISIFFQHGIELPQDAVEAVRGTVVRREYQDLLINGLARQVHTFQILEAIEDTEDR